MNAKQVRTRGTGENKNKGARGAGKEGDKSSARSAGRVEGQPGAAVGSGAAGVAAVARARGVPALLLQAPARAVAALSRVSLAAGERRRLARLAIGQLERARARARRAGLAAPLLLQAPAREAVGGRYGLAAAGVLGSSRIGDVTGAGTGGAAASAGLSALGVHLKFRKWIGEGPDKVAAAADKAAALQGAGYAQWWVVELEERPGRRLLAVADRMARVAADYSVAHRAERRASVHVTASNSAKLYSDPGAGAWSAGVEIVTTSGVRWVGRGLPPSESSIDEARAEGAAALVAAVDKYWRRRGVEGVNFESVNVRRFLGSVAWRAARRSLTELGGGFTGRRDAGARYATAGMATGAGAVKDTDKESLRRWAADSGGALVPPRRMPRFSSEDDARRASCAWVWRTLTRQPMPERGAAAARARPAARARARFIMRMVSGDGLGAAAAGAGFASAGAALASIKAGRSLELLAAAADGNGGWQRDLRLELRAAGLASARAVRMFRLALAGAAAGGELGAAMTERGRAVSWARELRARVNGASSLWRSRARDNGELRRALRGAWGLAS
ncbi:MAG: hypothetical protein K9N62_07885 [Verrucomicrobia bacterium]|nr:hypothetical protein [Verrucomicrobiota bacterium]